MIVSILTLVDSALIAALLLIIGFSGYENFVSKIGTGEHEDRPGLDGPCRFSDLKIKLMGAIVAISAVELLKAFINVDRDSPGRNFPGRSVFTSRSSSLACYLQSRIGSPTEAVTDP